MCTDCLSSHQNQITDYPNGVTVVVIGQFQGTQEGELVPVGTLGTVDGHCDDGRAVMRFKEYGVHTFHHPESYIARCY